VTAHAFDRLRLVGVAGTNKVMSGELSRLVRRALTDVRLPEPKKEGQGALAYPFDPQVAWVAVNYHRTSARVLWDLYRSPAKRLDPLYDDLLAAVAADDRPWLGSGGALSVSAYNVGDFAAGERQIVGTVKNALVDGARRRGIALRVDPEAPTFPVSVRLFEGEVLVSLDLAGQPMHQRGYRERTVAAPLREDLAAVLVMLARFDARSEVLLDPMAGSGTIGIEAASMADARPLWGAEGPACRAWSPFASFDVPREPLFADTRAAVLAVDRDEHAASATRQNAARAGVSLSVRCGDFRDVDRSAVARAGDQLGRSAERGLILSNPPYGERLGAPGLAGLYADLGRWARQFTGWRAGFLVANPEFEGAFGQRPRIKKPLSNGPLRGYFYLYDL
jgi:23S rRNA G2445 N2-methylase RlmL